ncbi:MAG: CAF17-like 4Fe-4S cluster assembly/insertion protein YgfZ [Phycisphaerales bacterium]
MTNEPIASPVHESHEQREAFFLPYGDESTISTVVETFGDLDMEYASIRKGCVIFDENHMGTIEITGSERLAFLNNMLTAKVDDLTPGTARWSFWLNRKGRIDADLRLAECDRRMLVRVDRHLAKKTAESLDAFLFAEDAEIRDASESMHRFAIHGPTSQKLISAAFGVEIDLEPMTCMTHEWNGEEVVVLRDDLCGEIGLSVIVQKKSAAALYAHLLSMCDQQESLRARPSGWMAINAARIESGHPLFNLDFGDSNLPVETGIIDERVHFAKGCYLGQEVVARMHARGACPRKIVAIRIEDQRITQEHTEIHQPSTGSQVFEPGKETETPVGVVTSSTISPMLGAIPICFAIVKADSFAAGTELNVSAEGAMVRGIVQEQLAFWTRAQQGDAAAR